MKIFSVTCVKNEGDIIEPFLLHNRTLLDGMILLDNGSTDSTGQIIGSIKATDSNVIMLTEPMPGKHQAAWATALMRRAFNDFNADWVVPLDADEFLVTSASRLSECPEFRSTDKMLELGWHAYVPCAADDLQELNPVRRITNRLAAQPPREQRRLAVPKRFGERVALSQGCHSVTGVAASFCTASSVTIAHFPVRSASQLAAKVALNGLQYLAMGDWPKRNYRYYDLFLELSSSLEKFILNYPYYALKYEERMARNCSGRVVNEPIDYRGGVARTCGANESTFSLLKVLLIYLEDLALRYAAYSRSHGLDQAPFFESVKVVRLLHQQIAEIRSLTNGKRKS